MAIGRFVIDNLKTGKGYPTVPSAKDKTPPTLADLDIDYALEITSRAQKIFFVRNNGEVWILKDRTGPDGIKLQPKKKGT